MVSRSLACDKKRPHNEHYEIVKTLGATSLTLYNGAPVGGEQPQRHATSESGADPEREGERYGVRRMRMQNATLTTSTPRMALLGPGSLTGLLA